MKLAQLGKGRGAGLGENAVGHGSCQAELVNGGAYSCHDALGTLCVEATVFVIAASDIEHLKTARYGA